MSSSSASSSSFDISSRSSFSFCREACQQACGEATGSRPTCFDFSSSSSAISRWCNRLNLLILSWSSLRTSTSSLPAAASSSLESYSVSASVVVKIDIKSLRHTIRRCMLGYLVVEVVSCSGILELEARGRQGKRLVALGFNSGII